MNHPTPICSSSCSPVCTCAGDIFLLSLSSPFYHEELHNTLLEKANLSMGRLDGASIILPEAFIFQYLFMRHEAILSSRLSGVQGSLIDFLAPAQLTGINTRVIHRALNTLEQLEILQKVDIYPNETVYQYRTLMNIIIKMDMEYGHSGCTVKK